MVLESPTKPAIISINDDFNQKYVYLIGAIATLGGLLFGFDLVFISRGVASIRNNFQLNESQIGWAVGCINLGAGFGALIGRKLSENLGRKTLLVFCAMFFVFASIGTDWANSYHLFIVFSILSGIAVGIVAVVCPLYVSESSPAPIRGRMVSFYQLSIIIGIFLAYLSTNLLQNLGENGGRWIFILQFVPALLFFFGLLFMAESPQWLIGKKRRLEAYKILAHLGGTSYANVETKHIERSFTQKGKSNGKRLFNSDFWQIIFVCAIITICSQVVGQNAVFSFITEFFR